MGVPKDMRIVYYKNSCIAMSIKRNIFGIYDYGGADLKELIDEIKRLKSSASEVSAELEKQKIVIQNKIKNIPDADLLVNRINYWLGLLEDFQEDFKRVLNESKIIVEERHVEIIKEKYKAAKLENETWPSRLEQSCYSKIKSEYHPILDLIFAQMNDLFYDYLNLNRISKRLKTFVGTGIVPQARVPISAKPIKPPLPEGTQWSDIDIVYRDNEMVDIKVKNRPYGLKSYEEMGFRDERKKGPDKIWEKTLSLLASVSGELKRDDIRKNRNIINIHPVEKSISILRRKLIYYFGIKEDPFFPFSLYNAYKTKFQIRYENDPNNTPPPHSEIREQFEEEQDKYSERFSEEIEKDAQHRTKR